MDGRSRRTRFEERVRIEREFLIPVNQKCGRSAPLAGMTRDAIDSWETRAAAVSLNIDVKRVAAILREASARAELLTDNSKDVFEAERRIGSNGLEVIRILLERALDR